MGRTPLLLGVLCACLAGANAKSAQGMEWDMLPVPGAWEDVGGTRYTQLDGFAWYRCFLKVPKSWEGRRLLLTLGSADDVDEAYFNSHKVGANGSPPPLFERPASALRRPFIIEPDMVRCGEWNWIAWRVYDQGGKGGLIGGPVLLIAGDEALDISGLWQFRVGDQPSWADWPGPLNDPTEAEKFSSRAGDQAPGLRYTKPDDPASQQAIRTLVEGFEKKPHPNATVHDKGEPLPPDQALAALKLAEGLAIDLVAHEPAVAQPIHLTFDERGRMWVTQYIQYPNPAGLKVISYDQHLRAVFDRVPPPPPNHIQGRDKITIHEDVDGDGAYEKVKTFVEGLSITTSVAHGRSGVWVLNPPYLLYYPDADRDDVPDGDPVVHLSGFGLEDTHAVANSLTWGPDGWLYGGVGSTVTARIKVHLNPQHPPVAFLGQAIWRYHPTRFMFEIFAEGGYNTFGVDFDDVGRVFSGTNGSPRGVHFVQGGYYRKAFGKHGPHTNPYALGYLDAMPHSGDQTRLTHQFILEGGASLPPPYRGKLIAVNSLANWVMATRLDPLGSTFKTTDEQKLITTRDAWFRPVHITTGPDGAAYISDWYDARITHLDPRDNWDHERGRIYRLRDARRGPALEPFDLADWSSEEVVSLFSHENRWFRQTALRVLADRRDAGVVPVLKQLLEGRSDLAALHAAWCLYQLGAMDEETLIEMLESENEFIRMWGVRLATDMRHDLSQPIQGLLTRLARTDTSVHVLSQLASSAARMEPRVAQEVIDRLACRDSLADDPNIPLQIWWATEALVSRHGYGLADSLNSEENWSRPLVRNTLMPRIAQRLASDLSEANQDMLAKLLESAPDHESRSPLVEGINAAWSGRSIDAIDPRLLRAIGNSAADYDQLAPSFLALQVRSGDKRAVAWIASKASDAKADTTSRISAISLLGQFPDPVHLPLLFDALNAENADVGLAAIRALGRFDNPEIATQLITTYVSPSQDTRKRTAIIGLLLSRKSWTLTLLNAIARQRIPKEALELETLAALRSSSDPQIRQATEQLYGKALSPTSLEKQKEIERLASRVQPQQADLVSGRVWFTALCSRCHKLYDEGLDVGPDLTIAKRDDLRELLLHIVDPSAGVHEDYQAYGFTLTDGRKLIGFVTRKEAGKLTIKQATGESITIDEREVRGEAALPNSLMPENLLAPLTDQQVNDLMTYLMSGKKP